MSCRAGAYVIRLPCRRGSSNAVAADPTASTPLSVLVSGIWPSYLGGGRLRTENDDDDDDDDGDSFGFLRACKCSLDLDCDCCVNARRSRFWLIQR